MQGFEGQTGFWEVAALAPELVGEDSVFAFLAEHRQELFPDELFEQLFPSQRGRPSIPGSVMASLLFLKTWFKLSDQEAADTLKDSLRWKMACGLPVDGWTIDPSTFSRWRARIAKSSCPNLIADAVNHLVEASGVLKGKTTRAADSTLLEDAVARQPAWLMLARQLKVVAFEVPSWHEAISALPGAKWHVAAQSRPEIDWSDVAAKTELYEGLAGDAVEVCSWPRDDLGEDQCDVVGLLEVLVRQDVLLSEGGVWRVRRGGKAPKGRVISLVDPQTRRAHKSKSVVREGFKAHIVAEPESGIVTAGKITMACGDGTSDPAACADLLDLDGAVVLGEIEQLLGDTAYSSAELFGKCEQLGVEPVTRPRASCERVKGGFTIDDFDVDEVNRVVTCPAGQQTSLPPAMVVMFKECGGCPLKDQCTTAVRKSIRFTPEALVHRKHRHKMARPVYQQTLRQFRSLVERSIAWLVRGNRRLRYRGVVKNDAWFQINIATVNLKRLLRLGLRRDGPGWVLQPVTAGSR